MNKQYEELLKVKEDWYQAIYADVLLSLLEDSLDEGY